MTALTRNAPGLTGNQLKLIALVAMTLDHIGLILLPSWGILRAIGRIAMPVFAWMIAEGCRHTHSRKRYLLGIAVLAVVCQLVTWLVGKSYYQGILVVFSLSVGMIFLWDALKDKEQGKLIFFAVTWGVLGLTELLPRVVPLWDFAFDYGFCGVILPVLFYMGKDRRQRLLLGLAVLALLSVRVGTIQWLCLLSVPLLALYNGQRGKYRLKYLFYIYYPLHLAVLYTLTLWI